MIGGGGFDFRDIIKVRTKWREQLARQYENEARRLLDAYTRTRTRITPQRDLLLARMTELEADKALTVRRVRGLAELERLIDNVTAEMDDFAVILRDQSARLQASGITAGSQSAAEMVSAGSGRASNIVMNRWLTPDPEMLRSLINYVDSEAMQLKFSAFGSNAGKSISDTILTLTAQGKNPRAIAQALKAWEGLPYAWAENTARTVQQYSYRQATSLNYRANSDVVEGYVWYSALDDRVCPSCISMHGTRHPNDQPLNDHHRGRCLVSGEMVKTLRGDVPIQDVIVGDYVYTHKGNWRRVVNVFSRDYEGDLVTIGFGDQFVTMTPEHPVLTYRGWVEAAKLSASDTFFRLYSSEVRGSRLRTIQPKPSSFWLRILSRGRLLRELCQRPSHSTASLTSGHAKSMLYVSTANCVSGCNPAALRSSRKRTSPSDMWLFVSWRLRAILARDSKDCPLLMNSCRASGRAACNRCQASRGLMGVISHSFMSLMRDRVLMPISSVSVRYDAFSSRYRRERYSEIGSPNLFSSRRVHAAQRFALSASGVTFGTPNAAHRWYTDLFVRPRRSATSSAVCVSTSETSNASSSGDQDLCVIVPSKSNGTIIHQQVSTIKVYDLEVEEDHSFFANGVAVHNCVPVPVVTGSRWADEMETGEQWFARQPESTQRSIMGKGMHAAYKAGDIDFSKLSTTYNDPVYGEMRRAATLKELVGER